MDETLVHAYGVVATDGTIRQVSVGIADTRAWLYPVEALAAIVSLLPSDGFGVADWERNAANLGWLESVARRHNEVLKYAATSAAVVPYACLRSIGTWSPWQPHFARPVTVSNEVCDVSRESWSGLSRCIRAPRRPPQRSTRKQPLVATICWRGHEI